MKVFITGKIPGNVEELFNTNNISTTTYKGNTPISKNRLLKESKSVDGILSLLTDKFDKEVIDNLTNCKIIANYAVGYNNIDINSAKQKGIIITNTPDILTDATADLAMALLLSIARRIPEGEDFMHSGKFKGWGANLLLGKELAGKTCGVVGFGRIGQAFAKRISAFGCKVIYYNRSKKHEAEKMLNAKKVSLPTLMKKSDFISLHLPLNEKTNKMIDKNLLDLMKQDTILVNTARGEIIDEKYLIQILKKNKIFGAGFDVYEGEPKVNENLFKLKNVVIAPHIGSATVETREKMAKLAAMNIINVLQGKNPLTPII